MISTNKPSLFLLKRSIFAVINMYKYIFSIFRVLVASDQRSPDERSIYLLPGSLCLACPAHIARAPYPFAASLIIIPWYLLPDVSFISVDGRRRTGWTWWSRESDGTSFVNRSTSPVSLRSRSHVPIPISKRLLFCIDVRIWIGFRDFPKFPIFLLLPIPVRDVWIDYRHATSDHVNDNNMIL